MAARGRGRGGGLLSLRRWNGCSVFGKRFIEQGTPAPSTTSVRRISEAFARYAPRYEGDAEFDVRTLMSQMAAALAETP